MRRAHNPQLTSSDLLHYPQRPSTPSRCWRSAVRASATASGVQRLTFGGPRSGLRFRLVTIAARPFRWRGRSAVRCGRAGAPTTRSRWPACGPRPTWSANFTPPGHVVIARALKRSPPTDIDKDLGASKVLPRKVARVHTPLMVPARRLRRRAPIWVPRHGVPVIATSTPSPTRRAAGPAAHRAALAARSAASDLPSSKPRRRRSWSSARQWARAP